MYRNKTNIGFIKLSEILLQLSYILIDKSNCWFLLGEPKIPEKYFKN